MLPFYDALGIPLQAILTNNGREFCGKPESHPYELLLALEQIEHRSTRVRKPAHQRLRRAHEPYPARRVLPGEGAEELLSGRTPAQALREALGIEQLPNLRFETPREDTEPVIDDTTAQEETSPESA